MSVKKNGPFDLKIVINLYYQNVPAMWEVNDVKKNDGRAAIKTLR